MFKKGDSVIIGGEGKHFGAVAMVDHIDDSGNIRVRIARGYEGAGQLIAIDDTHISPYFPEEEHLENIDPEPIWFLERIKQFMEGKQIWLLGTGLSLIVFALLLAFYLRKPPEIIPETPKKTEIEIINDRIIHLERQNLQEFEIQEKLMEMYSASVDKVKSNDIKRTEERTKIFSIIK